MSPGLFLQEKPWVAPPIIKGKALAGDEVVRIIQILKTVRSRQLKGCKGLS